MESRGWRGKTPAKGEGLSERPGEFSEQPNSRPAAWDVGEEKEWSVKFVASGEPSVTWRPAVGRTAGSGGPRRTSEYEEIELAVIEKRQNKANLLVELVALITGI